MTRDEHMAWCKDRAREYLKAGNASEAVTSMMSDLGKHDETAGVLRGPLGMIGIMTAASGSIADARSFIEGFN